MSGLEGFPITITVPVAWGEMDAFGHVNNIVYFRYFESARIAYLEAIGMRGDGDVGPILASTHCRFRLPLAYPDTVHVGARATDVGDDRFTMEYRVVSERHGAVAADGGGVVVAFDYAAGRKTRLPDAVRRRITELGGGIRQGG
ncbi:MAG TPA: thioesterase family protein [Longimicrobiales bacterium]|nr:thioesterase family protein [Longimicrobiales bacterium]